MKRLITNRYYITTIIAIFLSLSLGILIGGTLGQQWINENQQKLISHYQTKAEGMETKYVELRKQQEELTVYYQSLKEEYKILFTKSIINKIDGQKILWINDSSQNFSTLKNTLEIAGGKVIKISNEINILQSKTSYTGDGNALDEYNVILLFPNKQDDLSSYKWLLEYNAPIIYVTDNKNNDSPHSNGIEIDMYEQRMDTDSLNEHYNFILFLHNLLQENQNEK